MRLKSFLAIVLSAVLIVLGGMLPGLVGKRMDTETLAQVEYAAVNEVELQFAENDMTIREKLAIIGHCGETVEIPVDLVSRTQNEVQRIAAQEAVEYEEVGILLNDIRAFDVTYYCQPVLAYGAASYGQASTSTVFWNVTLSDSSGDWYLSMTVDDATGTVCSVEYQMYGEENAYVDMNAVLRSFCDVFLAGLGEEFYEYTSETVMAQTTSPYDGSYLAGELNWEDTVYGECRLIFFVAENRFSIHIN